MFVAVAHVAFLEASGASMRQKLRFFTLLFLLLLAMLLVPDPFGYQTRRKLSVNNVDADKQSRSVTSVCSVLPAIFLLEAS